MQQSIGGRERGLMQPDFDLARYGSVYSCVQRTSHVGTISYLFCFPNTAPIYVLQFQDITIKIELYLLKNAGHCTNQWLGSCTNPITLLISY